MADYNYSKSSNLPTTVNIPSLDNKNLFLSRLKETLNRMSRVINEKTSGYISPEEYITGQKLVASDGTLKSVYRKLIYFGQLPNSSVKTVPHGIDTSIIFFTLIRGTANKFSPFRSTPIPYSDPSSSQAISLNIDSSDVKIHTNFNATVFDQCYIVLEYAVRL